MNSKQRAVRWTGLVILVLMGAFPPWTFTYSVGEQKTSASIGYRPIWSPPSEEQEVPEGATDLSYSVDLMRASIQLAAVFGLINVGYYLLRSKRNV